jgi:hypothetical protein
MQGWFPSPMECWWNFSFLLPQCFCHFTTYHVSFLYIRLLVMSNELLWTQ